jgi:hypothetical protein
MRNEMQELKHQHDTSGFQFSLLLQDSEPTSLFELALSGFPLGLFALSVGQTRTSL